MFLYDLEMLKKIKRFWYNFSHPIIGEVWQLHRVRDNLSSDINLRKYEITPTRLESLIYDCLNKGYDFVSMDEVYDFVSGRKRCKSKFIAVTLDDGYEDNYSIAYPIFKTYNIPFCVYVAQSYITGEKRSSEIVDFKMLSLDQLKALSEEPLCTLGGHTKSHCRLSRLSKDQQIDEIVSGKEWLEHIIDKPVFHFAFPYGDYNKNSIDIMKECGIQCSVAAWGGGVRVSGSVYEVPRVLVTEDKIE